MRRMKGIRSAAICIVLLVFLMSINANEGDSSAGVLRSCGAKMQQPSLLFLKARDLRERVVAAKISQDVREKLGHQWRTLQKEQKILWKKAGELDEVCATLKAKTDATLVKLQEFNSRCGGKTSDRTLLEMCRAERTTLEPDLRARESEFLAFQQEVELFLARAKLWEQGLQQFLAEGERALNTATAFTGKRIFHLAAKSWIDPSTVRELTFKGLKFRLVPNVEPRGPKVTGDDDFKIYQSFVAEIVFVQGRITSARFVPNLLVELAGKTFRIRGEVRVIDQRVEISKDKDRAVFRRTVEGNPSMLILVPDTALPVGSMGFAPIFNTLQLEVTGDRVSPRAVGSSFPSHKFWIDGRLFHQEPARSRPSDYFR